MSTANQAAQPPSRLVVGDRFADFAAAVGADTLAGLLRALDEGAFDEVEGPVRLMTGQGMGDYEVASLRDALARRCLGGRLLIVHDKRDPAPRHQAHKAREDNVLVAGLTRTARGYAAVLRLHGHNEFLLDTEGWAHIQSMVAVEAARQMFLAVTVRFYGTQRPALRHHIVLNSMNTTFTDFLYPVPAGLLLRVERVDLSDAARIPIRATVVVEQAGKTAAETTIDALALAPDELSRRELGSARRALAAALAGSPGLAPRRRPVSVVNAELLGGAPADVPDAEGNSATPR